MDGSLALLHDAEGEPLVTQSGRGVLVLRGLLRGDIHQMRAQIDVAVARADDGGIHELEAIVLTRYPSFRVPDAVLRYAFVHVKRYAPRIANIYFVDLDPLKRAVFRAACLALPAELRDLVRLVDSHDLARTDPALGAGPLHTALPLALVAETLGPIEEHGILFAFDGQKRGSGGALSSRRWKRKRFFVTAGRVWYADASDLRLESERATLAACEIEVLEDGVSALIRTPRAAWRIRADSNALHTLRTSIERAEAACAEAAVECAA